jgi:UPF0042 nucleotide-binding protein
VKPSGLDVTIITGMSGAGRSEAAHVLEDLGFFVIDNLPPALVMKVAELGLVAEGPQRFGLVIDVRSGEFVDALVAALAELREMGARTRVLFLDAADDVLVRRYEATRRKHPLAAGDRVSDGIASERNLLEELNAGWNISAGFSSMLFEAWQDQSVRTIKNVSKRIALDSGRACSAMKRNDDMMMSARKFRANEPSMAI